MAAFLMVPIANVCVAQAPCPLVPCPPGRWPTPVPQAWSTAPAAPGTLALPSLADAATTPSPVAPPPAADAGSLFGDQASGAGLGNTVAIGPGGYIDNAVPVSLIRLRFDAAYRNNRPDRAEFFYPKCGCFQALGQTDAKGPPLPGETGVDYQELSAYLEAAVSPNFSIFGEVPWRFLNPDVNANEAGLGDVSFGFKYAFLNDACRVWSFQLRTTAPSGEPSEGLGTNNWSLEPGILFLEQLSQRLFVFGEFRDRIPVSTSSNFTGNVLRYGVGCSYVAYESCRITVSPVAEFVGWTVLNGRELTEAGDENARGDTIVNAKAGVRIGFGTPTSDLLLNRSDLYIGYGRALTGEVWYRDMLRVEYRLRF